MIQFCDNKAHGNYCLIYDFLESYYFSQGYDECDENGQLTALLAGAETITGITRQPLIEIILTGLSHYNHGAQASDDSSARQ